MPPPNFDALPLNPEFVPGTPEFEEKRARLRAEVRTRIDGGESRLEVEGWLACEGVDPGDAMRLVDGVLRPLTANRLRETPPDKPVTDPAFALAAFGATGVAKGFAAGLAFAGATLAGAAELVFAAVLVFAGVPVAAGTGVAAPAGLAPLRSFGLSTTFLARKFSTLASFTAISPNDCQRRLLRALISNSVTRWRTPGLSSVRSSSRSCLR